MWSKESHLGLVVFTIIVCGAHGVKKYIIAVKFAVLFEVWSDETVILFK